MDYVVRIYLTFVENCQTGFQSGCTVLHSHLLLHILTNVWCCQVLGFGHSRRSTTVFRCSVCISLMTHDCLMLIYFLALHLLCLLLIFVALIQKQSSPSSCAVNSSGVVSISS